MKWPTLFLKRKVKHNRTNAYANQVAPLREANTNRQFILDPHVTTSYYTSFLTKIDKSITNEFQTIINKCEDENIDANVKIRKLCNVFLNAQ